MSGPATGRDAGALRATRKPGDGRVLTQAATQANPGDMTDAEDCARYLRELASKADTPGVRAQIDACLEDYASKHIRLSDLAMAVQRADFPEGALTDLIRAWLSSRMGR